MSESRAVRFPNELAREALQGHAWFEYLLDAIHRETERRPKLLRRDWLRFFTDLVEDGLDPWLLACSLDILALRWQQALADAVVLGEEVMVDPWRCARIHLLLEPIRNITRRNTAYWRHVWLSRLCTTEKEADYCRFWLGRLEDELTEFEVINYETVRHVEEKLTAIEPRLLERRSAPDPFKLHYLEELLREAGR